MATKPLIELDEKDFLEDDTDVKDTVEVQESTDAESSPKETTEPEVAEPSEAEESETDPSDSEAKEDDEPSDAEELPSEDQPQGAAERRQGTLNTEIRDLVSHRNELRTEVERLNATVYAPQSIPDIMATPDEDTGLYPNSFEARVIAIEQERSLESYNNRIADAQLTLSTESERVLRDFPIFDPSSSTYISQIAESAATLLRQQLQTDQNTGQIIGSNVSPYQLYKTIADANQIAAVQNQVKGQQSALQMQANVEPQSSAVPKQPKEDPFLAGLLKGIDV